MLFRSVKVYVGKLKTVHKRAVRHTVKTASSVYSCDPELTEVSLLASSSDERIVERFHYRLAGTSVKFALSSKVTFGEFHYFSTLFSSVYASFNTHIPLSPLLRFIRNKTLDSLFLSGRNVSSGSESSLSLGGFFAKDMALVLAVSLNLSRDRKSVGRERVC